MSHRAKEMLLKALAPFGTENFIKIVKAVYLYGQPKPKGCPYFSEFITAVGSAAMKGPRDSAKAAQLGADIASVLEDHKVISVFLGAGYSGHQAYLVKIEDKPFLNYLWKQVPVHSVGKVPSKLPFRDWEEAIMGHEKLIHSEYMGYFMSNTTHPMVFNSVNRAQRTGWKINTAIMRIGKWALTRKKAAFDDVWERKGQAKESKQREVELLLAMGEQFGSDTFYHEYYYDFRGRRYPASAYLHEQGTDFAKALLLRSEGTPIGFGGYRWLLHMLATTYAGNYDGETKTDKLPRELRWAWAEDNETAFLSFAEDPRKNQGWMAADEPWQFLAYCIDLFNLRVYQAKLQDFSDYGYVSHMVGWMDGSTNGCQHLTAMTRDRLMAPYVNLTPSALPGDLYAYVAEHVWEELSHTCKYPLEEIEKLIDDLLEVKKLDDLDVLKAFRKKHANLLSIAAPYFWNRVTSHKERRKIIKR